MLQTEVTANTLHNKGNLNSNVAKTDKQFDIVKRLEELNKWQEEQKKLLEERQTIQRQMLGMEQKTMYEMLGLQQTDHCDLSELDEDLTPRATEQENTVGQCIVEIQEYEEDSTEESLTTSQLDDNEEEIGEVVGKSLATDLRTSFKTQNLDYVTDTARETKPKKPFLKRGEGLKQRFKIDPDQFRINNLPRYKYANAHPRLRLKPSNKCLNYSKSFRNDTEKKENCSPATMMDAQEQRFQNLLISSKNTCSSTPEIKPSISSKTAKPCNTSSNNSSKVHFIDINVKEATQNAKEFPPNEGAPTTTSKVTPVVAWSKILDPQQIEPIKVPGKRSQSFPQSEESIFELLEQKANDGSFDMDSTCLKQFMHRRLSEKLNETDDCKIPVHANLKTKRLEPVIVRNTSSISLEEIEDEQSQFTEESLSTESDETIYQIKENPDTCAPQNSQKMRVRFSESNETHEYDEQPDMTSDKDSTLLTACSGANPESMGQEDTTNHEFFQHFKQALFAALQLKADEYQNANETTQNSISDTTLTPKNSTAENNSFVCPSDLQQKSDMIKLRLTELEKEINNFKENNMLLMKAKQEHELEKSIHAQEHLEAMECLKDEKIKMEIYLHDERVKLEDEKRQFEQQMKTKIQSQVSKERKECERLREQITQLEIQLKTKESNHTAAQARLRTQIRNIEREQNKLHEQIEQLMRENKRLENENLKISREQNNKILLEINRNIAKLAPKQVQNASPSIPEEGPPTLGAFRTVSKCIVATATANKMSGKSHKTTNTHLPIGRPFNANTKKSSSVAIVKTDRTLERNYNADHEQQQQHYQQNIYEQLEDEDDDILIEFQMAPPSKQNQTPAMTQAEASCRPKPLNNNNNTPPKPQTQIPQPPPCSPRLSSDANSSNMKREIVNTDGSKDIWYPNGNLKKISPDGMIIRMLYYNKDIKETNINEGTVKYYYAETNTWHTTYLDGLEILEFPNGQIEHRHKNGVVEVHYPNNSVKIMDPNDEHKQEEWRFDDGTHLIQMRNGDRILSLPNGQKEIHNKLHKRREYPDGTVKIVYPDGSTETRYSNGRVRLKDKDGKLVMDTELAK